MELSSINDTVRYAVSNSILHDSGTVVKNFS